MANKVLIVDDTETMRRAEQMMLAGEGYDIDVANDGIDALDKIALDRPDLVLLDIMMPRMDGIECCRKIKTDDRLKDVKVVMVTTKSEYERVKEAFAAGCDDYITKPIDKNELITKLRDLMKFVSLRELLRS
ncbi:MAG: response regulator [Proteobacteria bacterium]|jgi:PleD family two-component response regulator|nr:response regulator [Pseudomonadota bacterium]